MKRTVLLSFLLIVFCACGQKIVNLGNLENTEARSTAQSTSQSYSKQNASQVYYVINSFALGPQLSPSIPPEKVELKPQTAKVELTAVSGGRYDMNVNYLFAYANSDKTKSFSIGLKDVPLATSENGALDVQVENVGGTGTLNSEQFLFDDVTVRGTIGSKKGASLSIIGKVQGKDFSLLMDSFTDQAQDAPSYLADSMIVDYIDYYESLFSNDSGMNCGLAFQLLYTPDETVSIAPSQTYLLSTYTDGELWGGGCYGVSISFADGLVKDYSGIDVSRQGEEVAQYLLRETKEVKWFLFGEMDGTIEKRYYTVETLSIRRPDNQ